MFLLSEQRLVDQENSICRNSWMTELEKEELERNLAENDSYKEKETSDNDTGSSLGEVVRDVVTLLEADEETGNFKGEEVAIIEKIAQISERRQKGKLPAPRDIPKQKLLEETAKVDKGLCKFETHSLTKNNEFFMQELLLLQIDWEERLIRQQRERNQCGGGGYKIRLKS